MNTFIDTEIQALAHEYQARTAKSKQAFIAANESLAAGNTRNNLYFPPYPPFFASANDCYLVDLDDNRYMDFLSDYTVAIYGHSNQRLADEVQQVLSRGTNYGGCIAAELSLAKAVQQRFPSIEKIRFANSGTEANIYALFTALAATKKTKVIVFEGNYHGGVMNYCHTNTPINAPLDLILLPYNDADALTQALEQHGSEVGAVIMELMMNTGGCILAEQAFVDAVREQTHALDIPLIIDEVMTARLGFHGLQQHYKVEADITTLGKMIGGGFSIGAFGGKTEYIDLYDAREPGYIVHGGSFNNNVFSMQVGAAALNDVLTEAVMTELNQRGEQLRADMNLLFRQAEVPLLFSGLGSVMNLHLAKTEPRTRNTNPVSGKLAQLYHRYLLNRGIWIAPRGLIALSIALTEKEFGHLSETTAEFVNRHRSELQSLEQYL